MPKPIHITTINEMNNDQLTPFFDAVNVVVSGTGTSVTNYKLNSDMFYMGTKIFFTGITAGDYFKIQVIDIDNVLGGGANAVVHTPVNQYYMPVLANEVQDLMLLYPLYLDNGLYVRFSYTTAALIPVVTGKANMFFNKIL